MIAFTGAVVALSGLGLFVLGVFILAVSDFRKTWAMSLVWLGGLCFLGGAMVAANAPDRPAVEARGDAG